MPNDGRRAAITNIDENALKLVEIMNKQGWNDSDKNCHTDSESGQETSVQETDPLNPPKKSEFWFFFLIQFLINLIIITAFYRYWHTMIFR